VSWFVGSFFSWSADERVPTPAELAFEIFFNLLIENDHLGHIAWDAGADEVLEGYDRLFSTAGLAKFTDGEREEAASICTRCRKRGDLLLMLFDHLHAAAKTRGREIVHFNMARRPIPGAIDAGRLPAMGAMECPEVRQRVTSDTVKCRNSEHRRTFMRLHQDLHYTGSSSARRRMRDIPLRSWGVARLASRGARRPAALEPIQTLS
jgi:hypothetical protein